MFSTQSVAKQCVKVGANFRLVHILSDDAQFYHAVTYLRIPVFDKLRIAFLLLLLDSLWT